MSITVQANESTMTQNPAAHLGAPDAKVEAPTSDLTTSAPAPEAEQKASGDSESQETESEVSDAESEGAESLESDAPKEEASEEIKAKKKSGFQKRVDKLNQRIAAKEQEAEYWRREALKNATAPKQDLQVEQPKTAAVEGKPKSDNFETHAEYVEALTDWKTKQALKEHNQQLQKEKLEIEQSKRVTTYQEKAKAFLETHPDFDEVVADVPFSAVVVSIIQSSENGPEIAYELGKNPDEAKRIAMLPPIQAAVELGAIKSRIASKASGEKKPETKRVSSAPAPIAPVGGSGKATTPKTLEDAAKHSYSEFKKLREEQLKKSRRRA